MVQRLSAPQMPCGHTFLSRLETATGCGALPTVPMAQRFSEWH